MSRDDELRGLVEKALKRAFCLGQTYWQQADSQYTSDHKRSDVTLQNFKTLTDETLALLTRTEAAPVADVAVSLNPIGYVDLASWQAEWDAGESFFTDYQDEGTQPIYTQAQIERAIEIAKDTYPHDASARDAERYRWLRDTPGIQTFISGFAGHSRISGIHADVEIDAAMRQEAE